MRNKRLSGTDAGFRRIRPAGLILLALLVACPTRARAATSQDELLRDFIVRKLYVDAMLAYKAADYEKAQTTFRMVERLSPGYRETAAFLAESGHRLAVNSELERLDRFSGPLPGGEDRGVPAHIPSDRERARREEDLMKRLRRDLRDEIGRRYAVVKSLYRDRLYVTARDEAQSLMASLQTDLVTDKDRRAWNARLAALERKAWQAIERESGRRRRDIRSREQEDRLRRQSEEREHKTAGDWLAQARSFGEKSAEFGEAVEGLYTEALTRMQQGEYRTAAELFAAVEELRPGYGAAADYLDLIDRRWGPPPTDADDVAAGTGGR